jgi:predicted exporter
VIPIAYLVDYLDVIAVWLLGIGAVFDLLAVLKLNKYCMMIAAVSIAMALICTAILTSYYGF